MIRGLEGILLFSEKARKLADFYKDVVGLELADEIVMGDNEEEGFIFKLGDSETGLTIMDHSEVKGTNKDPKRWLFNLETDDIEKEVERLKKAGAKIVQDIYHVQDYGQIATIADSDNNWFQVVQTKAS
jgi:predicted enzyme related to lactoylglutathione lyase